MTFGKILKQLRESNGYSMDKLVEIYNTRFNGKMNKSTLSRYENELQEPMYTVIVNLSQLFNVTVDYLSGVEDTRQDLSAVKIPVLGTVTAGIPIDAIENIIDYEEISPQMANTGEYFCLQVKGQSMEPKFSEGDVVVVRKQPNVESGEIAIVLVNGNEATIKKIKKRPDGIMLVPLNSAYDVMFYNNDDITNLPVNILGKVVELRAKF